MVIPRVSVRDCITKERNYFQEEEGQESMGR